MKFPSYRQTGQPFPEEGSLNRIEGSIRQWPVDGSPATLTERTRRVYDRLAAVYPISTLLFHSRAHRCALEMAQIPDGVRILEVATGSGEMFRRLVKANRCGRTVGVDLSPRMSAATQKSARRRNPGSAADCQAVDARMMPFRDASFDAVVCCYLLELLPSEDDIARTLSEFHRVLRRGGRLALVLIGQNARSFNGIYRLLGKVAPAFWGRQIERRMAELIRPAGFTILQERLVRQSFYPSRVLVAESISNRHGRNAIERD